MLSKKHCSKDYAKDRLKTVLISERMDCTPQLMVMMKNDLIEAVSKYLAVDGTKVEIIYVSETMTLEAHIPLHKAQESERTYAETI